MDGHDFTKQDQDATGWNDCDIKSGDHTRWNTFINELFDELCHRYAGKISGLWFDGVYDHSNKGHSLINHTQLRATVTAYDPTLALVSNIGTSRKTENVYATTDYSAWEVTKMAADHKYSLSTVNKYATNEDAKTWPGTSQQVAAAAVKGWWAKDKAEKMPYTAKNMFLYTVLQSSISVAGGYNIAACCFVGKAEDQVKPKGQEKGNIWENQFYKTMIEYHDKYLAPVEESVHDVYPGKAYVTAEKEWLAQKEWGVSTETPDGQYVYLRVVNPPIGDTLTLAEPADKSLFAPQATILNLGEGSMTVPVTKLSSGYSITLPEGTAWDSTDTVIKLQRIPYEITGLTVEPATGTQKKVTAHISQSSATERTPSLMIAAYSADGVMEAVETLPVGLSDSALSVTLSCPADGYFRAFIWDSDTNEPLAMPAQAGAE